MRPAESSHRAGLAILDVASQGQVRALSRGSMGSSDVRPRALAHGLGSLCDFLSPSCLPDSGGPGFWWTGEGIPGMDRHRVIDRASSAQM